MGWCEDCAEEHGGSCFDEPSELAELSARVKIERPQWPGSWPRSTLVTYEGYSWS